MAKQRKQRTSGTEETRRVVRKRKDIEKQWRKGTSRWKYDGDTEGEQHTLDRKRNAPRKHAIVVDELERDALVIQTGGPKVLIRDMEDGSEYLAVPRRSTTTENGTSTLIVVGDEVRYISADGENAVLAHVYERQSILSRRSIETTTTEQVIISNLDQVGVVVAASYTMLKPGLMDRYIIAAAMGGMDAFICINKIDLIDDDDDTQELVDEIRAVYEQAGYRVLYTSCVSGEGMDTLREQLAGKASVLSGHSGVGKTSILNALLPHVHARTQDLSDQSQRGIHTTTASTLYDLPGGGYLADTPGIREFGLVRFDPADLHTYYPEFIAFADECRFPQCTHIHEPGCAVMQAVEDGDISQLRYDNYRQILQSEEEYQEKR